MARRGKVPGRGRVPREVAPDPRSKEKLELCQKIETLTAQLLDEWPSRSIGLVESEGAGPPKLLSEAMSRQWTSG